ncbi:hypothetical protein PMYN1_Chma731 (chromatophore) [Paulinella micropora]|uniref:Uncharacterized protein n=1 Tax=Paulinella micropora TaxID=1928728 RepID=A0A1L5YCX1_9EUKA|nr:hypothetical protein PCKR_786 [Paulinella micropora]AQX45317.1 hypothetical protein PFK_786 [Paulinella micropora]BBL86536.1 hypothetical protein PMYN1_Chma731 [Paulinella micropora]
MEIVNISSNYQNFSVQLVLQGLAYDKRESNTTTDNIDILTKWSLTIPNQPRLEGSVNQLVDLIESVSDYTSRVMNLTSDLSETNKGLVHIRYRATKHEIVLHSSCTQENIYLQLDDSEFIDLVLCIDNLVLKQKHFSKLGFLPSPLVKKENFVIRFLYPFAAPIFSTIIVTMGMWFSLALPLTKVYNTNCRPTISKIVVP